MHCSKTENSSVRYMLLSRGGEVSRWLSPWLVVLVLWTCQSPTRVWLVEYLRFTVKTRPAQPNAPRNGTHMTTETYTDTPCYHAFTMHAPALLPPVTRCVGPTKLVVNLP